MARIEGGNSIYRSGIVYCSGNKFLNKSTKSFSQRDQSQFSTDDLFPAPLWQPAGKEGKGREISVGMLLYCEAGIKRTVKIWAEFVRNRGGEIRADRELEWGFGCLEL